MLASFDDQYQRASENVRRDILLSINQILRSHQINLQVPPNVTTSVPAINADAFNHYVPSITNIDEACWGLNRASYRQSIGDLTYNKVPFKRGGVLLESWWPKYWILAMAIK